MFCNIYHALFSTLEVRGEKLQGGPFSAVSPGLLEPERSRHSEQEEIPRESAWGGRHVQGDARPGADEGRDKAGRVQVRVCSQH